MVFQGSCKAKSWINVLYVEQANDSKPSFSGFWFFKGIRLITIGALDYQCLPAQVVRSLRAFC